MQSSSFYKQQSVAKECVINDTATCHHLLSFLGVDEQKNLAVVNKVFLKKQTQFYQFKLIKLEKENNQNLDSKNKVESIPFPTSAYLFHACYQLKQAPSLFTMHFAKLNQETAGDMNPIILLGKNGRSGIPALKNCFSPTYQVLDIFVKVCGYDINYTDKQVGTTLHYLLKKDEQSAEDKAMIRYCLASPRLTKETATLAFITALSNPRATIGENKETISITEILRSGKINFNDYRLVCTLVVFEEFNGNLSLFKEYIELFRRVPAVSFAHVVETILKKHKEKSFDMLFYLLEERLINLHMVCQNESHPISSLVKHAGHNIKEFLKMLDLFKKYYPEIPYPDNLFEDIVKTQGHQWGEDPERCVYRIMKLLNSDEFRKKLNLTYAKIKSAQKHTCSQQFCSVRNCNAMLNAYLESKALLSKICEDRSEYHGGFKLFSLNIGGISNKKREAALNELINQIETFVSAPSVEFKPSKTSLPYSLFPRPIVKLDLKALILAHPVLDKDPELQNIIKFIKNYLSIKGLLEKGEMQYNAENMLDNPKV